MSVFFGREYHGDFLICFDARTVGYIAEYAAEHLHRLEGPGKPKKPKQILALKEFCSEEGFQFRAAFSLFTVTDPC